MSDDDRVERLRQEITESFARNVIGRDSPEVLIDALNEHAAETLARFNRMGEGDRIRLYASLVGLDPEEAIRTVAFVQMVGVSFEPSQEDSTKADMHVEMRVLTVRDAERVEVNFQIDGDPKPKKPSSCPACREPSRPERCPEGCWCSCHA